MLKKSWNSRDKLARSIQDDIPWCMMFANNIVVFTDESREGMEDKLETWNSGDKLQKTQILLLSISPKLEDNQGHQRHTSKLTTKLVSREVGMQGNIEGII